MLSHLSTQPLVPRSFVLELRPSIEHNLKHPYSFLNLAVIYKEQENYEAAEQVISKGIFYNDQVSVLYYNRALFRTYLERFDEAIEDLKQSVALSPSLRNYAIKDDEFEKLFEYRSYEKFL